MQHHEQIDVLTFAIQDSVAQAMNSIRDTARNKNFLSDERESILSVLSNDLDKHINRHIDEFDVNMFEIVGIIETVKQEIIMNDVVDVGVIGCLDAKKIEVVSDLSIEFISDEWEDFDEY